MATRIPPLNPTPTRQAWKPTRKERQAARLCMSFRGCTMRAGHEGPHRVTVSVARIEGYAAFGVKLIVCPKCGFYGSGPHNADGVRCRPKGRNAWQWQ